METEKSKKEIFNIIKERRCFLDHFKNYKVKIGDSNNFEKENLIGIIKLTESEAKSTGYTYKLKILHKGGDLRIYGNPLENGHIVFDKIMTH